MIMAHGTYLSAGVCLACPAAGLASGPAPARPAPETPARPPNDDEPPNTHSKASFISHIYDTCTSGEFRYSHISKQAARGSLTPLLTAAAAALARAAPEPPRLRRDAARSTPLAVYAVPTPTPPPVLPVLVVALVVVVEEGGGSTSMAPPPEAAANRRDSSAQDGHALLTNKQTYMDTWMGISKGSQPASKHSIIYAICMCSKRLRDVESGGVVSHHDQPQAPSSAAAGTDERGHLHTLIHARKQRRMDNRK